MKLFDICNPDQFYKALDECKKPVFLTDVSGKKVSWEAYRGLPKLIAIDVLPEVEVTATCEEDRQRLIRFAMENRAS